MAASMDNNPSKHSRYLDDAMYDRLLSLVADWRRTSPVRRAERPNADTCQDCESILFTEARLADDLHLEDWLECYDKECIYWIPSGHAQIDPRKEVTLEIHDRRRLEDRVTRIRTGLAYSMVPPIRTRHMLSNIELWYGAEREVLARASFIIDALFKGQHRILSGWCGYELRQYNDNWLITVKQINLIDADLPQENNTFFL